MSAPYLDIHTHGNPGNNPEIMQIRACTAVPEHLPQNEFFTAGLHPVDTGKIALDIFEDLWRNPACIAIGECGLDRRYPDVELQKKFLIAQAERAEALRKPLIIHGVRMNEELKKIKRDLAPEQPWILHGFRGNARKTSEMLSAGFYLSFGAALLHDDVADFFAEIPADRIFFETDESGADVRRIYAVAASFLSVSCAALREQVFDNFRSVFHAGTNG